MRHSDVLNLTLSIPNTPSQLHQTFKGLPLARMIIHILKNEQKILESRLSTACSFRIQSSPLCDFPFGVFDFPIKKVFFAVNDKAGYLSNGLLCDNKS